MRENDEHETECDGKNKTSLNWVNDYHDNCRTCDKYVNKLLNNSSGRLCKSCLKVRNHNSKKPTT